MEAAFYSKLFYKLGEEIRQIGSLVSHILQLFMTYKHFLLNSQDEIRIRKTNLIHLYGDILCAKYIFMME